MVTAVQLIRPKQPLLRLIHRNHEKFRFAHLNSLSRQNIIIGISQLGGYVRIYASEVK